LFNNLDLLKIGSILLEDYFIKNIYNLMKSDQYYSQSEEIRSAFKVENKKTELVKELKIGEKSGLNENFERKEFFEWLHAKYMNNEI
jgi:antitoxin ParD1/3/4